MGPSLDVKADGEKPETTADSVYRKCLEPGGQEVLFEGITVTGQLNLEGAQLGRLVRFTGCNFTDLIVLTGAHAAKGIHLTGGKIRSLHGDRLRVDGDLVFENVHSDGEISLCGARVAGHLRCTDSSFSAASGKAFNATGMMVEGSALFDGSFSSAGEFILASARIHGTVDIAGSFSNPDGPAFEAEGIRVDTGMSLGANFTGAAVISDPTRKAAVVIRQAHVSGKIMCSKGRFVATAGDMAIDAELIEADMVLLERPLEASGQVLLDSSTVTGRLLCDGGKFCNPGGIALSANGLDCQDVRLGHGFTATGKVTLIGAVIARELNCSGGQFNNKGDVALQADGLICKGKVYLNRYGEAFHATGEVILRNARISTELNCSNGTFENSGGNALSAGGLTCDGNVFLNERDFKASGNVELTDAAVGRVLHCEDGQFDKLDAQRLKVDAAFNWLPRETPGEVDVSFANVGLLEDGRTSWPAGKNGDNKYRTRLAGFTFRNLSEEKGLSCNSRISGLRNVEYAPGVYPQLSRIYREKGLNSDAKKIAIAGQRDRRKRGSLPWPSRAWSWFLDYTVGYGYRIDMPLYFVLFWGLAGWLFFSLAQSNNLMIPVAGWAPNNVNASTCTPGYPCFVPAAYSFELFLPVINLRQVMYWLPNYATGWGKLLLLDVWFTILAGWLISGAVIAGMGHLFSQRN